MSLHFDHEAPIPPMPPAVAAAWQEWSPGALKLSSQKRGPIPDPPALLLAWCQRRSPNHLRLIETWMSDTRVRQAQQTPQAAQAGSAS